MNQSRPPQVVSRVVSFLSSAGPQEEPDTSQHRGRNASNKSRLPGGKPAIAAFCVSLVAFTIQTEAAQHVQQALGYRKPFLSLYLGHSSFIFLFPLHLFFLRLLRPQIPISHYLHLIAQNIHWQVSTSTHSLPTPRADSIRRRISTLSMRTDGSATYDEDSFTAADEFEVQEFGLHNVSRRKNLGPPPLDSWIERKIGFNLWKLLGLLSVLTIGLTVPALSWYSAVPLTTMADITTIYNTYAVWALVFSIYFLGEKWEMRKVYSVLLACGGVVLVAYGGAEHRRRPKEPSADLASHKADIQALIKPAIMIAKRNILVIREISAGNAFLGDLLAFFGAVTMAAYEMAFNIVGTLPDEVAQRERYAKAGGALRNSRIIDETDDVNANTGALKEEGESQGLLEQRQGEEDADEGTVDDRIARKSRELQRSETKERNAAPSTERTSLWRPEENLDGGTPGSYQSISPAPEEEEEEEEEEGNDIGLVDEADKKKKATLGSVRVVDIDSRLNRLEHEQNGHSYEPPLAWIPPPLPFGMHPIIITSGIGFVTMCTLWVGIPIASLFGWEVFELPSNLETVVYLLLTVFMGIIFNGCFSILLAMWGPVLASVSCLLTTVLVFLADIMLGHAFRWISLLGCVSIAAGFAVLVQGGNMH